MTNTHVFYLLAYLSCLLVCFMTLPYHDHVITRE